MKPGKRFEQWWSRARRPDLRHLEEWGQMRIEGLCRKAFEAGRQCEKQKEV